MDPKSSHPMMMAPPASAATPLRFPGGNQPLPRLDDHIAQRQDDPDQYVEYLDGQPISAMANEEHAEPQTQLAYVLRSAVAPGYRGLVELTTRHDIDQDFSSDACILREGKNEDSGERYLEELAFEVANTETMAHLCRKARVMTRRGVRRIFGIVVKKNQVLEWSPQEDNFRPLFPADVIADPCLTRPLPVKAILDAAEADNAVAQALIDKGNPILAAREAQAEARAEARGLRLAVQDLGEALDLTLSSAQLLLLEGMDLADLRALRAHLKTHRAWPAALIG